MAHQSAQGPFQVLTNIPVHYGGTGLDSFAWALCDAPLLLYALARFGLGDDPGVQEAVAYLAGLVRDNGWPCVCSPELGGFRGPGRKDDPCPYANLIMVQLLAQLPEWRDGSRHPRRRRSAAGPVGQAPRRAPVPVPHGHRLLQTQGAAGLVRLLHVLDVLSQLPWLAGDPRLQDMLSVLSSRADSQGRFTPQSVWTAWSGWDFGQKKEPSPWLTLLAHRVLKRCQTHLQTA